MCVSCAFTHVDLSCCLKASRDVDRPVAADTEFVIKVVSDAEKVTNPRKSSAAGLKVLYSALFSDLCFPSCADSHH